MTEIIGEILTECVQGTLWLFPAAGGVLFLSSISQVIRYERPGRILGVVEAVQIGVALVLCLLGLLNTTGANKLIFHFVSVGEDTVIGTTDRTSSLFNLVIAQWAIGAIAIVFLLLFLVKMVGPREGFEGPTRS
jgi:amino acid transporter